MDSRRRDGLLALATLTLIIAISIQAGAAGRLLDPVAALVGGIGSLALEALLLRYPERTRAVWERRWVQALAVASVVAVALAAAVTPLGPFMLAALAWGLLAYLCLLALVVAKNRENG